MTGPGDETRQVIGEVMREIVHDAVQQAVSEALARLPGHTQCKCGLPERDQAQVGRFFGMVRDLGRGNADLGIEEMRENSRFVCTMRQGVATGRTAAIKLTVVSLLTAVGAGLWLLFRAKSGN